MQADLPESYEVRFLREMHMLQHHVSRLILDSYLFQKGNLEGCGKFHSAQRPSFQYCRLISEEDNFYRWFLTVELTDSFFVFLFITLN